MNKIILILCGTWNCHMVTNGYESIVDAQVCRHFVIWRTSQCCSGLQVQETLWRTARCERLVCEIQYKWDSFLHVVRSKRVATSFSRARSNCVPMHSLTTRAYDRMRAADRAHAPVIHLTI